MNVFEGFGKLEEHGEYIMHYGMPRRSGRYPWGSGEKAYQHGSGDFLARVEELKKQGLSGTELAMAMGMKTQDFRAQYSIASNERKNYNIATAKSLYAHGAGPTEIGKKMGVPESTVRGWLNSDSADSSNGNKSLNTAKFLEEQIKEKGMIDIGAGVERELNISKTRMDQARAILEADGYKIYKYRQPNLTNPGVGTTVWVAANPKTKYKDVYDASKTGGIKAIKEYDSDDGGLTFKKAQPPASISSERIKIKYAEDGGIDGDGTIEIRPGVKDLSLGASRYAQVRIAVDNTHYLKGMAIYGDPKNFPKGVDIIFNTNKHKGTDKMDVLKEMKKDSDGNIIKDNPFGVLIKAKGGQSTYIDSDGKEKLSAINKLREEGDWSDYKRKLPAQFLSKQNLPLIKNQLKLDVDDKDAELKEIDSITNPTIKKYYLNKFAESCDKASYELKAAALPRQAYQVLIPVKTLKDNEIYAPNYEDGEKVALVRFPHGGTFEIPILTVNNKHPDGKKILGENPKDAVGINKNVADRLSGADYDGDTALVIPTGKNRITNIVSTSQLKGLEGFDPKDSYGTDKKEINGKTVYVNPKTGKEIKVMNNTQKEMGVISNLITDMTIKGAGEDEIARAVRHSMVVIDAEKHKLDYKKSEVDNNIKALKKEWQGHYNADGSYHEGASTLISRAKRDTQVAKREGSPTINKETGELEYKIATGKKAGYIDTKTGKYKARYDTSHEMLDAKNAHELSSGTAVESTYADYANRMKSYANSARKMMISTGNLKYSPSAKNVYAAEVKSLDEKINKALLNAPRERQAQIIAASRINALLAGNPELKNDKSSLKKYKQQALNDARASVGAGSKNRKIEITDKEWDAIQAGAITENKLMTILNNSDPDLLREKALPKAGKALSQGKINRIKAYANSGYTIAQIASSLGVSTTTVRKYM